MTGLCTRDDSSMRTRDEACAEVDCTAALVCRGITLDRLDKQQLCARGELARPAECPSEHHIAILKAFRYFGLL